MNVEKLKECFSNTTGTTFGVKSMSWQRVGRERSANIRMVLAIGS